MKAEALSFGPETVAKVTDGPDASIGKKVFSEFLIPGETALVESTEEAKSFIRAKVLSINEHSQYRVAPRCELFTKCGGCHLQHIELSAQRKFKQEMVLSMLRKQAGLEPEQVYFADGESPGWNYRNKITLHIAATGEIGLYRRSSSEIVEVRECPITRQEINQTIGSLRAHSQHLCKACSAAILELDNGTVVLTLLLRSGESFEPLPELLEDFPRLQIKSTNKIVFSNLETGKPASHFSQVNDLGNQALIRTVSGLVKGDSLCDLYAGSGNISIPLAKLGKKVIAVEIDQELVRHGKSLAEELHLTDRISFINSSCEDFCKKQKLPPSLIIDPPRAGAKAIIPFISAESTDELIYVSCDLASFCRDSKALAAKGLKLMNLVLIDMFPQTYHIELAGLFKRGA